jgi:diguanylate cyclase (GGDEF)-like protein
VLRQVAKVLEMTSRTEETVARYGGEEFIMIAPMATLEELGRAAERLRRAVELVAVDLPEGGVLEVTASFGVAAMEVPRAPEAGQRLIAAADAALYEAKANGRNCVVVAPSLIV